MSTWRQRCVAALLTLHLVAVLVSLLGSLAGGVVLTGIRSFFHPYLAVTHFAIEDEPLYLAHGRAEEMPLELILQPKDGPVQTLLPPLVAESGGQDRQQRFLRTVALLVQREQPSLVAQLLLPVLQQQTTEELIGGEVILRRRTSLLSDTTKGEFDDVYRAHVVKDRDEFALVQSEEKRLSSQAVPGRVESPAP